MQALFEKNCDFFAQFRGFFPQEGQRAAQNPSEQAERPANRLPDPVKKQGDGVDNRAGKRHDQPAQRKIIGDEAGGKPQKQVKSQLSPGQRQVKQERSRRGGDKKEQVLKKHRHRTARNHQPDHPEHIIIDADEKAEPAA